MAGGSAVNRGPHTGAGTEGAATDLPRAERKSLISSFDFDELLKTHLPPTANIQNAAVFDKDDAEPVASTLPTFAKIPSEDIRSVIDLFLALNAPAAPAGANEITLAGTKYTVSGPRGAQFPLELAVLHSEKNVLFASVTATLLVLIEAAPGADMQEKTDAKEGVRGAIRSLTHALSEKGI